MDGYMSAVSAVNITLGRFILMNIVGLFVAAVIESARRIWFSKDETDEE